MRTNRSLLSDQLVPYSLLDKKSLACALDPYSEFLSDPKQFFSCIDAEGVNTDPFHLDSQEDQVEAMVFECHAKQKPVQLTWKLIDVHAVSLDNSQFAQEWFESIPVEDIGHDCDFYTQHCTFESAVTIRRQPLSQTMPPVMASLTYADWLPSIYSVGAIGELSKEAESDSYELLLQKYHQLIDGQMGSGLNPAAESELSAVEKKLAEIEIQTATEKQFGDKIKWEVDTLTRLLQVNDELLEIVRDAKIRQTSKTQAV